MPAPVLSASAPRSSTGLRGAREATRPLPGTWGCGARLCAAPPCRGCGVGERRGALLHIQGGPLADRDPACSERSRADPLAPYVHLLPRCWPPCCRRANLLLGRERQGGTRRRHVESPVRVAPMPGVTLSREPSRVSRGRAHSECPPLLARAPEYGPGARPPRQVRRRAIEAGDGLGASAKIPEDIDGDCRQRSDCRLRDTRGNRGGRGPLLSGHPWTPCRRPPCGGSQRAAPANGACPYSAQDPGSGGALVSEVLYPLWRFLHHAAPSRLAGPDILLRDLHGVAR